MHFRDTWHALIAPYNRCQQQFFRHASISWTIIKDDTHYRFTLRVRFIDSCGYINIKGYYVLFRYLFHFVCFIDEANIPISFWIFFFRTFYLIYIIHSLVNFLGLKISRIPQIIFLREVFGFNNRRGFDEEEMEEERKIKLSTRRRVRWWRRHHRSKNHRNM